MAKRGHVTGIFSLSRSDEREDWLIFPDFPIHSSNNVLFYKIGSDIEFTGDIEELEGMRIGVTRGYTYAGATEFLQGTIYQLDEAPNDETNMNKLLRERIDLFICDRYVGLYLINKMGMEERISYFTPVISSADYYIAFTKDEKNYGLASRFDQALRKAMEENILENYFPSNLK